MSAVADEIVESCGDCTEYFEHRSPLVLLNGFIEAAERRGVTNTEVAEGFVVGLHARHLAGLSIAVRPYTDPFGQSKAREAAKQVVAERLAAQA